MATLNVKLVEKKQVGSDTFLKLQLSEDEKDGSASVTLELTLHDVVAETVDVKRKGMLLITKEGAPVIINFSPPLVGQI